MAIARNTFSASHLIATNSEPMQ